MKKSVKILNETYKIKSALQKDDECLSDCDAYCDYSIKTIVYEKFIRDAHTQADLMQYTKQIVRHEIVHAFLYESGLDSCTASTTNWAKNEEMVDWLSIQGPKIMKAWEEAEVL